jgi:RecA/RadA recombinase
MTSELKKILEKTIKKFPKITRDVKTANAVRKLKTDSPQLNYLFSGGVPVGRIINFHGMESQGKSTISIYIASQFQKHSEPKHQTVVYLDFERSFDPQFAQGVGLDVSEDKFIYLTPDTLEDAIDVCCSLIVTEEIACIILDSDASAPTRVQMVDEFGRATFGSGAKVLAEALRKMNILCSNHDTTFITISQERANMNAMAHLNATCVVLDTMIEVESLPGLTSMSSLLERSSLNHKTMAIDEFYDISSFGFKVSSKNLSTNAIEMKPIKAIVYKGEHPTYELRTPSGVVALRGSGAHRVFDVKKNNFVALQDVTEVYPDLKSEVTDRFVVVKTDDVEPIVDIHIDDYENYYTNGILSHNTGGFASKFYPTARNRVSKTDVIKEGNDTIGIEMRVRNYKYKAGIAYRDANMKLYFGNGSNGVHGFDTNSEYIQFIIELGIVTQKGAYFQSTEHNFSLQGRQKLQDWLDAHPEEYAAMKLKVDDALSKTMDRDANNVEPSGVEVIDEEIDDEEATDESQ